MLNKRIRVDLHIHSNESWHKDKGIVDESDINHLDVLLNKLDEYGVNLISITDHNYLNAPLYHELERVISEGNDHSLSGIIPGVEFDVVFENDKPKCHVMAYFNVTKPEQYDHIAQVLEGSSMRTQEFEYGREAFEKVIYDIGLSTILLAYQRRDPENKGGGDDNSFSLGVNDYIAYLQAGYISGFDLQKPRVEGMILSRLSEVESVANVASLIASDCHQWSVYPWHSAARRGNTPPHFSEYNALPTFRGLQMALSSPETRFNRVNTPDCRAIASLAIGQNTVPLSPGLNAIIGENGSGKSTLLHILAGKPERHHTAIAKENSIEVHGGIEKVHLVKQASLARVYATNTDLEQEFGIDYYPSLNGNGFRSAITNYVEALKTRIRKQISANASTPDKRFEVIAPSPVYYVAVVRDQMNMLDDEEASNRVKALNEIIRLIDAELSTGSYSEGQRARIDQAKKSLSYVLREKEEELKTLRSTNRAMGVIIEQCKAYESKVEKKRSSADAETRRQAQRKTEVINGVCVRAKAVCNQAEDFPTFPKLDEVRSQAHDYNTEAGYRFVAYYPFYNMNDSQVESELIGALFTTRSVVTPADYFSIDSEEKWIGCVKGAKRREQINQKLGESLRRFLDTMTTPNHEIHPLTSSSKAVGNTLGERSLVFFKVVAEKARVDDFVLLIDQPEDNVSNSRISSELASSLNSLRDNHQVIFVTHNPLLVVNQDVDNVICVKGNRVKRENETYNEISIVSGCLEDEESDILGIIAQQMDGGRDAIRRRLDAYGDSTK